MIKITTAMLFALTASVAMADPSGRWRTATNEEGSYLIVEVGPCKGEGICGVIVEGRDKSDTPNPDYEHLGRDIISDMKPDGENKWSGGRIWAPDDDKTYNAKMELKGDILRVDGCILFICRGQDWTRE